MPDPGSEKTTRGVLGWTIQTVAVLGVLTVLTTQVFIRLVGEPLKNSRIAATHVEPETTGSIGRAARETRLDPCAVRGTASARR